MNSKFMACAAILLATMNVSVADANEDEHRAAFRTAYAEYEEVLDSGDVLALVDAARRAYQAGLRHFEPRNGNLPRLAVNYGNALVEAGDNDAGIAALIEASELYEARGEDKSTDLIPVFMQLGDLSGIPFDARPQRRFYRRALKIVEHHYGKDSAEYAHYSMHAGVGIVSKSSPEEARPFLEDGYEITRATLGPDHPRTGIAAYHFGRFQLIQDRYESAEEYLLEALRTLEDPSRPSSKLEVSVHAWLVNLYQETGRPDKSTVHCRAIGEMTPYDEDQPYQPIYRRAPTYPLVALRSSKSGFVDLRFTVTDEGFVEEAEVLKWEGHESFADAALDALQHFRFAPRFANGAPVATRNVDFRMSFEITR